MLGMRVRVTPAEIQPSNGEGILVCDVCKRKVPAADIVTVAAVNVCLDCLPEARQVIRPFVR